MAYKYLLFDADETLFDFRKDEISGFYKTLEYFGISPSLELFECYSKINRSFWEAFERNEITKEDIGTKRYDTFLKTFSINGDGAEFNRVYMNYLSDVGGNTIENANNVFSFLYDKGFDMYIITNGTDWIQKSRLKNSGLSGYFKKMYVSEEIKVQKPMKEFFDFVIKDIGEQNKNNYLIIGDSLTSDILGGINSEIDTIWFNYRYKMNNSDIIPTFEVHSLTQIIDIIMEK